MKELVELFIPAVDPMLRFCSTFLWQLMLIVVVYKYRADIVDLLKRLAKLKIGSAIASFYQEESAEAESPGGEFEKQVESVVLDSFFSREGIRQIVEKSALNNPNERVVDMLLIFKTRKQHTWLVFTNERLWCILDSERTRTNKRLIQWKLPYQSVTRIRAKESAKKVGRMLLDIGPRTNWLYSRSLHPDQGELEIRIQSLIESAKRL